MMEWRLEDLKPLTAKQYDIAKRSAQTRILKSIGPKPTLAQFQREHTPLWTVLDLLALVVFLAALTVSSVHIVDHMGDAVQHSLAQIQAAFGELPVDPHTFKIIHQITYIVLAEGSMLLFMVMLGISKDSRWRQAVYLILALASMAFTISANLASGIGILESLMPPAFTIGVGFNLERLIVGSLERRQKVMDAYTGKLKAWETASEDATRHADYMPVFKREVWDKLVRLKVNQGFVDAPAEFKRAAVEREMEHDNWAYAASAPSLSVEAEATQPVPFVITPLRAAVNGQRAVN